MGRKMVPQETRAMLLRLATWALLAAAVVYLVVVGLELVHQAADWSTLHRDRDFPSYYLAAQRLLRGQDAYSGLQEAARQLGIADYFIDAAVNPPTFTVAAVWLALFPYVVSWGLWQVLSLAALILILVLLFREAGPTFSPVARLRLTCAALLFPPLTFHLLYAHTELFLLLALVGAWLLLRRGKEIPAGLLLGLAAAIRIYPLFLLLYLLLRRAWKALWAAVLGGLAWAGLSLLVAGPGSFFHYLTTLRGEVSTLYGRWGNFSLWGSVHKLASIWPALGARPLLRDGLALVLSAGVLLLTLWLARRCRPSHTRRVERPTPSLPGPDSSKLTARRWEADWAYGLFIVGALLASPLSWVYYQVLLYLPLFFLVRALHQDEAKDVSLQVQPTAWRRPAIRALLLVALLASLAPLLGGLLHLPAGLGHALAFAPTLTLVGVYGALIVVRDAAGPRK